MSVGVLSAWLYFRIKFAGTGYRFMPSDQPKKGKIQASYVKELYDDLGESLTNILTEEPLSPAAIRIREQRLGPNIGAVEEKEHGGLRKIISHINRL